MSDRFAEMWLLQQEQQNKLGLEPSTMSDIDRRALLTELITLGHEEVSELGRLSPSYKRHLLRQPVITPVDAAEAVADVLKTALAWAQLVGLDESSVVEAFRRKTAVVAARAEAEKMNLQHDAKLLCVDIDDVVCDITELREGLSRVRLGIPPGAAQLDVEERYKDEWYTNGKFLDCPVIAGAPEALRKVHASGLALVYVTARPQWQYRRIQADTLGWFKRQGIPCDLVLFNKDKCEAVYQHIAPAWPVAFVEDHERNAKALAAIGINVLLFDQPHNAMFSAPGVTRVNGWSEVLIQLGIR